MTEKRFKEIISIQKVIDNETGKEYDCLLDDDLLELLNQLDEENKQLKHDATTLIYSNKDYREKNKLLESSNQRLADMADVFESMAQEFDEENTRLRILLNGKRTCSGCKNLCVIVSERSDYWCSRKDEYMNLIDFHEYCDLYEVDTLSLSEKEHKVWD